MINAQAAVLRGSESPYTIEQVTLDEPGSTQVVVRVTAAGFCHTDVLPRSAQWPVQPPLIPGHEGAGVVESVGPDVEGVQVGDHVVLSFSFCGECSFCQDGHPAYCDRWMELNLFGRSAQGGVGAADGEGKPVMARWFGQSSFATHVVADRNNVVVVDRDLPLDVLGPLGCGVLTGAGTVFNVFNVQPGNTIAIFGVGAVGLAALLAAKEAGAEHIVAIDLQPARLELAAELGATKTILGDASDVVEQIQSATGGGAHFTFDTTGVPPVILTAIQSLRARGVCGLVGVQAGDLTLDPMILTGKSLVSVVEGDANPQTFIPHLVELWRAGKFPFDRLIEKFALSDINSAEKSSLGGQTIKPVLVMPAN
jgi:aryl-alcohol dehydrogenase